jgi:hypothetical protein
MASRRTLKPMIVGLTILSLMLQGLSGHLATLDLNCAQRSGG